MAKEIIIPYQNKFYLTGGTALAGFYLFHRYSEDLDFFSEEEFDASSINIFFRKNKKFLGIRKIDYQQSYNRNLFFLTYNRSVLKTEFTYFPFPAIDKNKIFLGVKVDNVLDIAVNKLFSIYQRSTARDYIDLYFIIKKYGYSIEDLLKKARVKFDWHIDYLQLGTQFVKAVDVLDYPRMVKKIKSEKWKNFFVEEAKKFENKIIK